MKRGIMFGLLFVFLVLPLISAAELKVTNEHPFYVDGEWIKASDLAIGDEFKTIDGKTSRITNIIDVESMVPFLVYNIEDLFFHNYVVDLGLIVHNSKFDDITKETREITTTNSYRLVKDEIEIKRLVGFNPEDARRIPEIETPLGWGRVRKIDVDGEEWAYKLASRDAVKNELANRHIIEELGKIEGLEGDFKLVTNQAFGYKPSGISRFSETGEWYEDVLLNKVVEGETFSLARAEGDVLLEDSLVGQINQHFGEELAGQVRADMYLTHNIAGLGDDMNPGAWRMQEGTMHVYDMEQTGVLVDRTGDWQQGFLRDIKKGTQHGWGPLPEHNTLAFKDQLIKRARTVQANRDTLVSSYKEGLEKAGIYEGQLHYHMAVQNFEKNIDNLVDNIEKEWEFLSNVRLTSK